MEWVVPLKRRKINLDKKKCSLLHAHQFFIFVTGSKNSFKVDGENYEGFLVGFFDEKEKDLLYQLEGHMQVS